MQQSTSRLRGFREFQPPVLAISTIGIATRAAELCHSGQREHAEAQPVNWMPIRPSTRGRHDYACLTIGTSQEGGTIPARTGSPVIRGCAYPVRTFGTRSSNPQSFTISRRKKHKDHQNAFAIDTNADVPARPDIPNGPS